MEVASPSAPSRAPAASPARAAAAPAAGAPAPADDGGPRGGQLAAAATAAQAEEQRKQEKTQRLLRHGYEWWLAAFSSCTGIFGGYNLGLGSARSALPPPCPARRLTP